MKVASQLARNAHGKAVGLEQFCWLPPLAASAPAMRQPVSAVTRIVLGNSTGSFRSTPSTVAILKPYGSTVSHSAQLVVAIGTPLAKVCGAVFCTK